MISSTFSANCSALKSATQTKGTLNTPRRYHLDWLRVIAFAWLILYHIGMYYVADWPWHIKSEQTSAWLQWLMLWSAPWRMLLLFVISGMALSLVSQKRSAMQLLKSNTIKIMLPLVCAMYLIVPPQLYIELITQAGLPLSYWPFYIEYINPSTLLHPEYRGSPLGLLTWNHLWFLPYLFSYTIIYLTFKSWCDKQSKAITTLTKIPELLLIAVLLPLILLTISAIQLKADYPQTNALIGDWYNHARYFTAFIFGLLLAKQALFWQKISQYRFVLFLTSSGCFILIIFGRLDVLPQWVHQHRIITDGIGSINSWGWICTLLAYSYVYLNKPSKLLSTLNCAILPCYILHQTIIVLLAFSLAQLALIQWVEAILLIIATFALCWLGYLFIITTKLTKILFGLKP